MLCSDFEFFMNKFSPKGIAEFLNSLYWQVYLCIRVFGHKTTRSTEHIPEPQSFRQLLILKHHRKSLDTFLRTADGLQFL